MRFVGQMVRMGVLAILLAGMPATVGAEEDGQRFVAAIHPGTCEVVESVPVAELGELKPGGEEGDMLAEGVEPAPEIVYATRANVAPALDTMRSSEHVVVVRGERDGETPVVACGQIAGEDDGISVELEPFGDTGIVGQARLEARMRASTSTEVTVGVWDAPAGDGDASDMPEAPDFALTLLDGEAVQLSDYRGKTVVVVLWASWCPYCDAEFPMYQEMWEAMRDDDVVFLGVGLKNDDQGDAEAFVEKHGVTFPVGRDTEGGSGPRGEIESTFGVPGTPAVFIITPDGHVYGAQFGVIERGSFEDAIEDASTYRDDA